MSDEMDEADRDALARVYSQKAEAMAELAKEVAVMHREAARWKERARELESWDEKVFRERIEALEAAVLDLHSCARMYAGIPGKGGIVAREAVDNNLPVVDSIKQPILGRK